jgi:hypothetical protein
MSEDTSTPRPPVPQVEGEQDVEGHAFKWQVVSDPRTGEKRLRSGWTPDDGPQKPATAPQSPPKR